MRIGGGQNPSNLFLQFLQTYDFEVIKPAQTTEVGLQVSKQHAHHNHPYPHANWIRIRHHPVDSFFAAFLIPLRTKHDYFDDRHTRLLSSSFMI